nr:alpha/beta hydrolase [Candidatus Sigynarchaeum springense]MDO8116139.1 alpha/beta hydrolase [Candidatus Sigynarchaeota archaeon]
MAVAGSTQEIEWGKFDGRIPYVKVGSGPQKLVYFSGGGAFLTSVDADPITRGKAKAKLLTSNQTIYILGYPRNLPARVSLEDIANELAKAIQNHLGKSIIIGNSFGGLVAIAFAKNYPELTEKLILTNCAYTYSHEFIKYLQQIIKLGENGKVLSIFLKMNDLIANPWSRSLANIATVLPWARIKKKLNPITELTNALRTVMSETEYLKACLPFIKASTVIIGGTADKAHSAALFRETASLIPNAKLVLFPGYGHEMEMEHGAEFREAFQKSLE